jgi:hypothetical protein
MRITSETPYDTTRVRGVLLPLLVVHGVRLLIGGAGIASLSAIHRPLLLLSAFTAIGVGWCRHAVVA